MDTIGVSTDGLLCFREGTMKGGPLKMPIWSLQGVGNEAALLFFLRLGFISVIHSAEFRSDSSPPPLEAFLI
jgi:hypothetical protein